MFLLEEDTDKLHVAPVLYILVNQTQRGTGKDLTST